MTIQESSNHSTGKLKRPWIKYLLLALICEKIIQHILVTLALLFDWGDIRSTVAIAPTILICLGAIVAVLFVLSLWAILSRKKWARTLVIALAFFDIIGEFIAQGRLDIVVTVSFLVAIILLVLAALNSR